MLASIVLLRMHLIFLYCFDKIFHKTLWRNRIQNKIILTFNTDVTTIYEFFTNSGLFDAAFLFSIPFIILYAIIKIIYFSHSLDLSILFFGSIGAYGVYYAYTYYFNISTQYVIISNKYIYILKNILQKTPKAIDIATLSHFYFHIARGNSSRNYWMLVDKRGNKTKIYETIYHNSIIQKILDELLEKCSG